MPEKLEVTASAPAYSDQRSAGTNSSSTVILTKRSGEQQRGACGEEERHFNSLFPFVVSTRVTPYVTVLFLFYFIFNWETEKVSSL